MGEPLQDRSGSLLAARQGAGKGEAERGTTDQAGTQHTCLSRSGSLLAARQGASIYVPVCALWCWLQLLLHTKQDTAAAAAGTVTLDSQQHHLLPFLTFGRRCRADVIEGGETAFPDSNHWVDKSLPAKLGPFSPCAAGSVAFKPKKVGRAAC